MKRRKTGLLIIAISVLMGIQTMLFANTNEPSFYLNGRERFDVQVVTKDYVTYVPLRIVGEELGAQVNYNALEKSVIIMKKDKELRVQVGEKTALLNGELVEMESPLMTYTYEGKNLIYVPLRIIFETFDGVVTYNKEYNYINAYNKNHTSYKALEGLKSKDLTTYRFAQLALPKIHGENIYPGGGRVTDYIFPLNKKTDYFFIASYPSGDMDVSTIAYMKVENGVAVCKWYKELRGDVKGKANPQDNSINIYMGNKTITNEIGEFPEMKDTTFISFTRHSMCQPGPTEKLEPYQEFFNNMIRLIKPQESKSIPQDITMEGPIISPYLYANKRKLQDGSLDVMYYNDELLSKVDEASLMKK